MSDKTAFGKVHSMELGIYHEFPVMPGRSQAECFAAGFDIVDASEEYGLDVMWLAELHFDKRRALAASPLVLGTAIAARTERISAEDIAELVAPEIEPLAPCLDPTATSEFAPGRKTEAAVITKAYGDLDAAFVVRARQIQTTESARRHPVRRALCFGERSS